MDFQIKMLSSWVVLLALAGMAVSEPMAFTIDWNRVNPIRDTPGECHFLPFPCGNLTQLPDDIASISRELDIPPPPLRPITARKPVIPYEKDYEVCPYIRHEDTWIYFKWGDGKKTYLRFLDEFVRVTCLRGFCDKYVIYNDIKFGCVVAWEFRTFNVLWPTNADYIKYLRSTGNVLKCGKAYCLVRIRLQYPASCKCAKRNWENVCREKLPKDLFKGH